MKKMLMLMGMFFFGCSGAAELSLDAPIPTATKQDFAPYATGRAFFNEREKYTVMPGVFATLGTDTRSTIPMTQTNSAKTQKVLATKANFTIFTQTDNSFLQPQSANNGVQGVQATQAPSGDNKLVVYNNRTKSIGVVMGQIIVRYEQGIDIHTAISDLPVTVVSVLEHIDYAHIQPNNIVDIFTLADSISNLKGVVSVAVEILENQNKPL